MSSQKTEHYQLHKWEEDDDFLRTEFNENFAAIDGVLGAHDGALDGKADKAVMEERLAGHDGTLAAHAQAIAGKADLAALEAKCEVVTGSFTGDGTARREFHLGFRPRVVVVTDDTGTFSNTAGIFGGVTMDGAESRFLLISDTGFVVYDNGNGKINLVNQKRLYFVLK